MPSDNASKSLLAFVVYLIGLGLCFVLAPNLLLGLFGFPEADGPWVRIVGLLALILAYYYSRVVQAGLRPFYAWTVHTRLTVLPFFVVLVLVGLAPPILIAFGVLELGFTTWTWLALRGSEAR